MGAGRCASCLLLGTAGRIGWTGVAKAGEEEGIGCAGNLKGVFATGRCGSAAIVDGSRGGHKSVSSWFNRQPSRDRQAKSRVTYAS